MSKEGCTDEVDTVDDTPNKREDPIQREVRKWRQYKENYDKCRFDWVKQFDLPDEPQPKLYLDALVKEKEELDRLREKDERCARFCDAVGRGLKGEKQICLAEWWYKLQELRLCPWVDTSEYDLKPKSVIYKYLWKAELFRETFGDSAVPTFERVKRKAYEDMVDLPNEEYSKRYNRKRVCDPLVPPRYNKRRRIVEHFEDQKETWICKHDIKPCNCEDCKSEEVVLT